MSVSILFSLCTLSITSRILSISSQTAGMSELQTELVSEKNGIYNTIVEKYIGGNYQDALSLCAYYELALAESLQFNLQEELPFFTLYLTLFLLLDDMDGARFLWRRSSAQLKTSSNDDTMIVSDNQCDFVTLWNVAQAVIKGECTRAYSVLSHGPWSESMNMKHVEDITNHIRSRLLTEIKTVYSSVSLDVLSEKLNISKDLLTVEYLLSIGMSADPAIDGIVNVRHSGTALNQSSVNHSRHIDYNNQQIHELSAYVSHFERKMTKVNISKLVEHSSSIGSGGNDQQSMNEM